MSRQLAFKPASERPLRPKVLLYGYLGTGKTVTMLRTAAITGAKLAVADTESSTDPYGSQFPFEEVHTDDPAEVEGQVDGLLEDPRGFTMFGLDSATQLHDRIRQLADAELRAKREKKGGIGFFESAIDFGANSRIATITKLFYSKVRRLDMAVIATAHEDKEYESKARAGGGVQLVEKGIKPGGHKSLGYWFDLVLRLQRYGNSIVARAEKTRGIKLEKGDSIEEFSAEKLVELYPEGAWTREATALPVVTDEQRRRIEELIVRADLKPFQVAQALTKYGASEVGLLGREHAETVIANLTTFISKKRR